MTYVEPTPPGTPQPEIQPDPTPQPEIDPSGSRIALNLGTTTPIYYGQSITVHEPES